MNIDNKLILENSKSLNILYVEDDNELRKTTSILFENYFNKVDIAVNGQEGYEKYRNYQTQTGEPYDIVITDINMPQLDGIEMSKKIKILDKEQVIIVITAFGDEQHLYDMLNSGINGFLSKPIEMHKLKNVFYSIAQLVTDRKLVKMHYEQIEQENTISIKLLDASSFNTSKDILKDLEKNKEEISKAWVKNEIVQARLAKYMIDSDYFRTHYGIKVIEYFLNVIKGDSKMGNCPVVFAMLDFFKHKDLALEDIFMICVHFKNSMSAYIFDKYSFNHTLFDDISLILDRNFEGVIVNYLLNKEKNREKNRENILAQKIVPIQEEVLVESKDEEEVIEDISYVDYVLESDVYELQDLEEDIDNLAIVAVGESVTEEDIALLGENISRYGTILTNYPLFSTLGIYIHKLGINFIDNAKLLFEDRSKMSNISTLAEGFVNDLIVWRREIFENNIANPHFLDSSFFSNVDTIIMFIEYDESAESTDDEMLDDDIFF